MIRWLTIAVVALLVTVPVQAAGITGHYLEARTCEVFTGPCFSNADTSLTGRHAVMAWKIDKGELDQVALDGLGVVAVVAAADTLGLRQVAPAKAVLIVDNRATTAQREALVRFARRQAGELLNNIVAVETAAISLDLCACKENSCARLSAGTASTPFTTRAVTTPMPCIRRYRPASRTLALP
jgi:hypothetical protein